MMTIPHGVVVAVVLLLSAYSVIKFAFFFVLPYAKRRAMLDKSYDGRAYATGTADIVLLMLAAGLASLLLVTGAEPIAFLGGIFVGATLIQLFFHAFHEAPPSDREAPEPRSPLKRMSYAIQDRPEKAWKEMVLYTIVILAAVAIYLLR